MPASPLRAHLPPQPVPPPRPASPGTERTWNFKQEDIVRSVDAAAGAKAFDLSLTELGPYSIDFTRSGRHMLLGGAKGHLALMDWQRAHLVCEVQVRDRGEAGRDGAERSGGPTGGECACA